MEHHRRYKHAGTRCTGIYRPGLGKAGINHQNALNQGRMIMDPNATLREIHEFLAAHETGDQVDIWCEHLYQWIKNGGFEPDWAKYELGTSYYRCRCVSMRKPDYDPVAQ